MSLFVRNPTKLYDYKQVMKTLGIIGYGNFGSFAADKLSRYFKVKAYDPKVVIPKNRAASLKEVCSMDFVMIAIPLSTYKTMLTTIKNLLAHNTIVIDICSVKLKPTRYIKELLPNQPFIALHPLFGPQSAQKTLKGHTVIICESSINTTSVKKLCLKLGLQVTEMSAVEHDKEMAVVQALTFFVARSLNEYGIHNMKLKTPSFQKLLDLAALDKSHTDELIQTILLGNEHAQKVRHEYMKNIEKLDQELVKL
jgi:prephenate dehydrogenase